MGKREKSACTQHGSRGRCDEAQAGERHEGGHEGRARGMVPEKKAREAVSARESGSEKRAAQAGEAARYPKLGGNSAARRRAVNSRE